MSDGIARPAGGPLGAVGLRVSAELEVIKAVPESPGDQNEEDDR